MPMGVIGLTTGCLYKSGIPLEGVINSYLQTRSNAIELSFATPSEILDFEPNGVIVADIKRFYLVSIHAPWKEVRYSSDAKTKRILNKLRYLSDLLGACGIVLHPDGVDDFALLQNSGLPFLIENMDCRKSFGTTPEHIEKLKKDYNFGFVFDVQHAYEHDPTMGLATKMLFVMGDRLRHMHVSGQTERTNHSLVHLSDNKKEIMGAIRGYDFPVILEGILDGKDYKEMNDEIHLINSIF